MEYWDAVSVEKMVYIAGEELRNRTLALAMMKKGLELELIAEVTGLSAVELQAMAQEL